MSDTKELLIHLEYIRDAVDGVNARLDAQNGRIRTAETKIAILEDRAQSSSRKAGSMGATAGGFVGGALLVVYQLLFGTK